MKTNDEIRPFGNRGLSLFDNCDKAYKLIADGKESEAKEKFPLEFYLLKKYMNRGFEDFFSQLKKRVLVESN